MILPTLIVSVGIRCLLPHVLSFLFRNRLYAALSTIGTSTSNTTPGRSLHQFSLLKLFLHLIPLFCKLPVGGYVLSFLFRNRLYAALSTIGTSTSNTTPGRSLHQFSL